MRSKYVVLLLCCFLLSSCSREFYNFQTGLESFHPANSEVGVCDCLIPNELITSFEYINGDYYKEETASGIYRNICERALVYFEYEDKIYNEAKLYTTQNLILNENIFAEYNGYTFFINETYEHDDGYPRKFKVFGYNDEKNTLVFLGFYVSVELYDEVDALSEDWPAFLEKYYGEWYSFS